MKESQTTKFKKFTAGLGGWVKCSICVIARSVFQRRSNLSLREEIASPKKQARNDRKMSHLTPPLEEAVDSIPAIFMMERMNRG